jgi:hypothetical protein
MAEGRGACRKDLDQNSVPLWREPDRAWKRSALQQATLGKRDPTRGLNAPELFMGRPIKSRKRAGPKNVIWWKGDVARTEGNFTRAMQTLVLRGLLERSTDLDHFEVRPRYKLTEVGKDIARQIAAQSPHKACAAAR